MTNKQQRWRGLLLGTAVGDSVGLPAEGISRRRNHKLFRKHWRQGLIFNYGMISDDTEHTVFVAQALLAYPNNVTLFRKRLAMSLRWWLLSLPAGVGLATGRAIIKLWLGFNPKKSGVYSAGNGVAMRVAPIGAFFADNAQLRADYIKASTNITHTDPKALIGATAIAEITAWSWREQLTEKPSLNDFIKHLHNVTNDEQWLNIVSNIEQGLQQNLSVEAFAETLGLGQGITGYIYHTVPMVLYAWYQHFGDFEQTLSSIFNCGGDTDTTGAIVGALAGSVTGEQGIPAHWLKQLKDYPRSVNLLRKIADNLANDIKKPVFYFVPAVLIRNLFFLLIVLLHGFRRLLPPY